MDLNLNYEIANNYRSASQKARVLTEYWMKNNMYCPRCGNSNIIQFQNNKPVADFFCPNCKSEYELKSKNGNVFSKISDGAYETMIHRITSNNNPDLFVMRYSLNEMKVNDLFVIPKHFFVPEIIEKRNPLKETAKRAGWIGCNILLKNIPIQGRIPIIDSEKIVNSVDVIEKLNKANKLIKKNIAARGWLLDVLNCINNIPTEIFKLEEIYQYEDVLFKKHPLNNNVKAKIRQQLQFLRDKGYIEFVKRGVYKKL